MGTDDVSSFLHPDYTVVLACSETRIDSATIVVDAEFAFVPEDESFDAYHSGVSVFNRKKKTFTNLRSNPKDPLSLSGNDINDIYKDKNGVIWAIAQSGTVNRYDKNMSKIMIFHHFLPVKV